MRQKVCWRGSIAKFFEEQVTITIVTAIGPITCKITNMSDDHIEVLVVAASEEEIKTTRFYMPITGIMGIEVTESIKSLKVKSLQELQAQLEMAKRQVALAEQELKLYKNKPLDSK